MTDNEKKLITRKFLENNTERYIVGRNKIAQQIIGLFPIKGIVDEFTSEKSFNGISIIPHMEDLANNTNAIVLSCSVSISPITVLKKVASQNITCIDIFSFIKYSGIKIEIPLYIGSFTDFSEHYNANKYAYDRLIEELADETSKDTLRRIIDLRTNLNLEAMNIFRVDPINQYFEDFLNLQEGETFVDVGGFDGDTSSKFIELCPKYSKIFFLEPMQENLRKAQERLKENHNIIYLPYAVSDEDGVECFEFNNSASSSNCNGSIVVQKRKIDNIISHPITFLKMDIEGAESSAIKGAEQTIRTNHPKIAISVYHRSNDILDIYNQIKNIWGGYNVYLRHYTEGTDETVMFFIP